MEPSNGLYEKEYTYNNIMYNVVDTFEVHKRLQSDMDFFNSYFEENCSRQEAVGVQELTYEIPQEENQQDNFVWTRQNTKLLLQKYAEKKNDFRNPKIKKKSAWQRIVEDFAEKGYTVTIDMLDRKMRNMKHSFKVIKDNNKKSTTGRGRIQWEWFEIMDNIFLEDRTINVNHTICSLPTISSENAPKGTRQSTTVKLDNIKNTQSVETMLESQSISTMSSEILLLPSTSNISQPCTQNSISEISLSPKLTYENGNLDSVQSKSTNSIEKESKAHKARRSREAYELRKGQLESEKKRTEAINILSAAIEESNQIQRERNTLLKTLIDLQNNKS